MPERDVDNLILQRLATRVRVLRAQHRWNQETLAELAGMHRTTIGQIERGGINLGVASLAKIAQAFAVPMGELVDDS
ncbi:MAG: helix-turn-helix domain-containing protein [Acidiferrobacteraceae bacterium]